MERHFSEIIEAFGLKSASCSIQPYGNGHINATYLVENEHAFILQKVNTQVFAHPEKMMHNWLIAKAHFDKYHPDYLWIDYLTTTAGKWFHIDTNGYYWRMSHFVESTSCVETAQSIGQAALTAKAFGNFAARLSDCNPGDFHEILHRFHDLSYRQQQFDHALLKASSERKKQAHRTLLILDAHRWITDVYARIISKLPVRIVHMDAKISNVLFDADGSGVKCLIDPDTMMPGTLLSDAGDMIRSMSTQAAEDEPDESRVLVQNGYLEAIVNNYVAEIKDITDEEKELIPFGGIMLVYMQALRFMTDFLENDHYYRVHYATHNLVRARNQAALLRGLLNEPLIRGRYHKA